MITVEDEVSTTEYPPLPGGTPSIRNERIKLIQNGLDKAGLDVHRICVEDYSAAQAYAAFERHRDTLGWVCLSDEIAIAIKHLLLANGDAGAADWRNRILGFDGSKAAARHQIASIGQHIDDIGRAVHRLFEDFFRTQSGSVVWPTFREFPIEVELIEG
jgi:DNA-binding LacI/PurR family transcriptional regulator